MPSLTAARSVLVLSLLALGAGCSHVTADDTANESNFDLTMAELPIRLNDIAGGTFDQQVEHSEAGAALGTFKQRYWYSTQFATGEDSPVIFYFCGESECSAAHLTSLGDTAKTLKAAVVALEHRYYGKSLPFAKPTVRQMQHLTIHNALEDAASFEAFAKSELKLRGKWIAVGGSYPGMLAAFYREKHPDLVVGAWASSAPVLMQESFYGYDQVTARALGPTCGSLFRKALGEVEAAYDDPDPSKWEALTLRAFGRPMPLPPGLDAESAKYMKAQYMAWVSGQAMGAAQRGYTNMLCSAIEQHAEDPIEGLIRFQSPPLVAEEGDAPPPGAPASASGLGPGGNELADEGEPQVDPPAPTDPLDHEFRGHTWSYQECAEVGFFKVHNPNREESIMSTAQDVDVARMNCQAMAGVLPNIEQTRATYLDAIANGQVTNLYFVNGSLDPWSSLSYTDKATAPTGMNVHVIARGSHCNDLQNLYPGALLGVFEAHKQFHDLAVEWLSQ